MAIADELTAVLQAAVDEHGTPGAAAGVLAGDEVHVAAVGVTSVEHPLPVTPGTLFQVGSITKTVTAAAVMLLVEEDRIDLADPVARHLPDLSARTGLDLEAMTVEHLLSHRSGFDGDHLLVTREGHDLGALAAARRLFPPGEGTSYSNAGFSIAGAVVEAASGRPFDAFVRERLLRPLAIREAAFQADDVITHRVAAPHWVAEGRGYLIRGVGWQPGWELSRLDRPAGGLVASVEHLLAWTRFQRTGCAADGTTLLRRASLDRLHAPVARFDVRDEIGLDWFVRTIDGVRTIGHGGTTIGYISDMLIVPERDVAVVGLTNATNGALVNRTVRRWALERCAGVTETDPLPDPGLATGAAARARVDRVTGRYLHPFAVLTVTGGTEPGTIVVTPSRRDDMGDIWQPPLDPVRTFGFFTDVDAVAISGPGTPPVVRFAPPSGDGERAGWVLSGHRRAVRID